jgi:hypothetical protein
MSRNRCLLRYGWCSCDLYRRCSVWFPSISAQLSAVPRTEVRTRISWQAFHTRCCNKCHWSALNTLKYLGVPTAKNPKDSGRGSCRPVYCASASYPLFTESLVQVLSDSAEEVSLCSIMHEPLCCWWRGTCSKSTGKSFTKKRWYTAPDNLLGKTTGRKSWSPKVPTQTYTRPYPSTRRFLVIWVLYPLQPVTPFSHPVCVCVCVCVCMCVCVWKFYKCEILHCYCVIWDYHSNELSSVNAFRERKLRSG